MGQHHTQQVDGSNRIEILIRPNRSLTPAAMLAVVMAVALVSLAIGLGFWMMGAHLILPFAGLEALVVGVAFWSLSRHQADYERIVIDGDQVELMSCTGEKESRTRFQRYWARVHRAHTADGRPPRILLGSHGRFVEVGSALDGPAREVLARELMIRLRADRV